MDVKQKMMLFSRMVRDANPLIVALTASLSAVGGAAAGYTVAMKKLEKQFAELAGQEIAEAKAYYQRLYKTDDFSTPEDAVRALGVSPRLEDAVTAIEVYQGHRAGGDEKQLGPVDYTRFAENKPSLTEVVHNVFTDSKVVDVVPEEEDRDPEHPYLITKEECFESATEFDQVTVTYYVGDDVLVDDKESPIDEVDEIVGVSNLQRFGEGSGDPNVVYVRNNRLGLDYEIVRSKGKYAVDVLGLPDPDQEIRHAYNTPRRFRVDDD